ncbi:site-specific integrase [Paraburkholderia aromaticivorans]|uniref:hypothetical protein n=1 Tax=Paraburkholderia aromaticivorans TaxID=2026199 RepID=UPI0038BA65C8
MSLNLLKLLSFVRCADALACKGIRTANFSIAASADLVTTRVCRCRHVMPSLLQRGRSASPDRYLFIFRSLAPLLGLIERWDGIGTIGRRALNRGKVGAPHRDLQQFWHALVLRMLQLSAPLPEIGQVSEAANLRSLSSDETVPGVDAQLNVMANHYRTLGLRDH